MSMLIAECSIAEESVLRSEPETLADLVHRLGDIPLERILVHPSPGTAVEQDLISRKMCELIDGVVVEKALSFFESRLAMVLLECPGMVSNGNRRTTRVRNVTYRLE